MEPITTTAMISTVVGYLAKKLKDTKSVQDFFKDFTDATVQWVRPLFLKDENRNEKIIEDLLKNPESDNKKGQVAMAIASHLEDNPNHEIHLQAMYDTLLKKVGNGDSINITNSTNVNTGTIHAGGSVTFGNNNTNSPK